MKSKADSAAALIFKGDQGCHAPAAAAAGRTTFGDLERDIWRFASAIATGKDINNERERDREREREKEKEGGWGLTSEVMVSVNSGATSTLSRELTAS